MIMMMTELPLKQTTTLPGHVKVRLVYETREPTTESALMMSTLGIRGPFREEIWILVPKSRAFSILPAYHDPFSTLKESGVLPQSAKLIDFKLELSPSPHILAYAIED